MADRFTEPEKRCLLAEIIKASDVPVDVLLKLIQDEHIRPRYDEIIPPPGRNLRSCTEAYELLVRPGALVVPDNFPLDLPSNPRKRTLAPATRELQPKPEPRLAAPPKPAATSEARPRKRGRPSKAELASRLAIAAGNQAVSAPPTMGPRSSGAIPMSSLIHPDSDGGPVEKLGVVEPLHQGAPTTKTASKTVGGSY